MAMKSRMKGGPRNTITSLQVKVQTNWLTPHGMGGIDSTGKLGAGGEFAKQATQWLTPNVPNGGRSVPAELVASKGTTEDGERRTVGLESQTKHWDAPLGSAWPTQRQTDGSKGGPNQAGSKGDLMLPSAAAQWPTPNAHDGRRPGADLTSTQGGNLSRDAVVAMNWPTPASRDHKGTDLPSRRGGGELEPRCTDGRVLPLFAPGPADPRWAGIIGRAPWLAPATEPGVRMLVDGMALLVDESRAHQLRQVGNGVCPLQAAVAFVTLATRAGWGTVK